MSYAFETPVQQHFCTLALSRLVSPALLTTVTHSFLWRQGLSDELPRPVAIASQYCIPCCKIPSWSWFVTTIFPFTRCVFHSQWFSIISPLPAIPPEIIHYNLFQSCPVVASNSTWMSHHNLYHLLHMYWEEIACLEVVRDNKLLLNFISLNDWK